MISRSLQTFAFVSLLCSISSATPSLESITLRIDDTDGGGFFNKKKGFAYDGMTWAGNKPDLAAELTITYDVETMELHSGGFTLFTSAHSATKDYTSTLNVNKNGGNSNDGTPVGPMYISDEEKDGILALDLYDCDGVWGGGLDSNAAAFSGDEVYDKYNTTETSSETGTIGTKGDNRRFLFYVKLNRTKWRDLANCSIADAIDAGLVKEAKMLITFDGKVGEDKKNLPIRITSNQVALESTRMRPVNSPSRIIRETALAPQELSPNPQVSLRGVRCRCWAAR
ncbi:MAG: hypothetical protein P8L85_12160 [Rubripirellula sp.]|nr:hypothetical protein [Rubripirellula sp.]